MVAPYLPIRRHITGPDGTGNPDVLQVFLGQSFLDSKQAVWSTDTFRSRSGRRWTSSNWTFPVWKWSLPYEFLRRNAGRDELGQLWAFFNSRRGAAGQFLFLDRDDNAVENEVFGIGDGLTTVFQLTRSLFDWVEPVLALNGAPAIAVGGVPTTALTVDAFAVVTFAAAPPPGALLSWTGSYLFRCAFTTDTLAAAQMFRRHWSAQIEFESLK